MKNFQRYTQSVGTQGKCLYRLLLLWNRNHKNGDNTSYPKEHILQILEAKSVCNDEEKKKLKNIYMVMVLLLL